VVLEIAEEKIEATSNNFEEVFSFVSLLKENNLGTNRIMRSTSDFIKFVDKMTPNELVKFTILFTSEDMQQAFDIHRVAKKKDPEGKTLIDTLEDALVQHFDKFTVIQFAAIANSIGYSYTDEPEDMIHLDRFLEVSRERVISWLNNDQITDLESLTQIVMAFCESYPEDMDPVLFDSFEYSILRSAGSLDYHQALLLMSYVAPYASTELMEVFDRIIGLRRKDLTPSEAMDALTASRRAEKAVVRQKFVDVMCKIVSQNLHLLSTSQLVNYTVLVCSEKNKDLS